MAILTLSLLKDFKITVGNTQDTQSPLEVVCTDYLNVQSLTIIKVEFVDRATIAY
jgi:hypothetical protein